MSGSRAYYQLGATAGLVGFFNNKKRLALLDHLLPTLHMLKQATDKPLEILDLGAGTGFHAAFLAKKGNKVTAVEPVEAMLAEGRKLYQLSTLNFILDALPKLEQLGDKKFDFIYSIATWQYIEPEERNIAMQRMISLLKSGGRFAIVWPIPESRELQFPLSYDDIHASIKTINETLADDQQIQITINPPIPDPDARMGYKEKTEKVFFHTLQGYLPPPTLRHELKVGMNKN